VALADWPLGAYFALLIAVFVVAAGSGALSLRAQSERDALRTAERDAGFVSRVAAQRIGASTSMLQSNVALTAATPGLAGLFAQPGSCTLTFAAVGLFTSGHYDVVGPDGSAVCSSRPGSAGPATPTPGWMGEALQRPLLLAPVADPGTGALGILSTAPIPGGGVMTGFVDLAGLGGAVSSLFDDSRRLEFLVTSRDGQTVLTRSIDPGRWVGAPLARTAFARAGNPLERPDVQGTPRLYGESPVAGTGWRVYVGADRATAFADAMDLFRRQLWIILAGLVATLAAAAVLYRRMAHPIQRLSVAVRAATARASAAPVRARGPREVRSLARDFNTLMGSVDRELTDRKRAEEEVRSLNRNLEAKVTERTAELQAANSELEAFSYRVSHDLRAPLRAVSGLSALVVERHAADLPEEGQRMLREVVTHAGQMGELMDALLMLSRLGRQDLRRETVEPADLVAEVMRDLAPDTEGRRLELVVGSLVPMQADRPLMRQVMANLLSNAVKFTARRDPAVIEVGCRQGRRQPVYYVRDNGAGFDRRYADKLFQVFQRLHSSADFEGTGVGLALVDRIVRRHGGRIWAEGEVDRGATFFFTAGGGSET
jgi:signal transduction histidine kinase